MKNTNYEEQVLTEEQIVKSNSWEVKARAEKVALAGNTILHKDLCTNWWFLRVEY